MKQAKYYYNTKKFRYEKVEETFLTKLLRVFGFMCAALVFAVLIVAVAFQFLESPQQKQLQRELVQMEMRFGQLNKKVKGYEAVLSSLQNRDADIYRTIFEAEPIPQSVRDAGFGGGNRFKHWENVPQSEVLIQTAERIEKIGKQLYIQSKSYDEIVDLIKQQKEMYASIPAIQPVSNRDLKRIVSGFGMRMHPIYKVRRMHTGMDFSAPKGTDVYATGKGVIVKVEKSHRGYGHSVTIKHGFSYKTLYAHLSEILVKRGQKVNRGDVIGKVGNTGMSTGSHLHYEVIKAGKKVNPVNYFYNDLSPKEFSTITAQAAQHNQSFD